MAIPIIIASILDLKFSISKFHFHVEKFSQRGKSSIQKENKKMYREIPAWKMIGKECQELYSCYQDTRIGFRNQSVDAFCKNGSTELSCIIRAHFPKSP